jgi:hypothetical protein
MCFGARQSPIRRALSIGANGTPETTLFIIRPNKGVRCLEKTIDACHMSRADERPGFGFAGCVHELHSNEFRPASSVSQPSDNPGHAGCLKKPRDSAARISEPAASPYKKDTL